MNTSDFGRQEAIIEAQGAFYGTVVDGTTEEQKEQQNKTAEIMALESNAAFFISYLTLQRLLREFGANVWSLKALHEKIKPLSREAVRCHGLSYGINCKEAPQPLKDLFSDLSRKAKKYCDVLGRLDYALEELSRIK